MTRLFLRFYLGVIAAAVVAFLAASELLLESTRQEEEAIAEDALLGGATMLVREINALPRSERPRRLAQLEGVFRHGLAIVPWDSERVPAFVRARFEGPRKIAYYETPSSGSYVATPLTNREELLVLGPLPEYPYPSTLPWLASLAIVMLIAGLFMTLAFRPLRRELQALEMTAERLSRGDFSARVSQVVPASLPLARALDRMAEETERLVRGQRELFHMVSHELRTPIARLRFALALLHDSSPAVDEIERDVDGLEELIDELLMYARVEHAIPALKLEPIDVTELLEELAQLGSGADKQVVRAPFAEAMQVCGDARLVRRALRNLVVNALRHARTTVALFAERDGALVKIHVDDDGPGVALADRERAFAPFVRLREEGAGSGLGLAIVRRITEWHGGRVQLDDAPLGGARVTSEWPVAPR